MQCDERQPLLDIEGRERVLRSLARSHQRRLYRLILRTVGDSTEAEEITQNAYAEAVTAIARFRGESEPFGWLAGIAMNMVRNHLSRSPQRKYSFADAAVLQDVADDEGDPMPYVERTQMLRMVQDSLPLLQPQMREALLLVAVDQVSYEDAATTLDIPIGTVRSRVSRARGALRDRFKAAGIDSPV